MTITVRWKDNQGIGRREFRNYRYKKLENGWIIEDSDDKNIYHCMYCVMNAIDKKVFGDNVPKNYKQKHKIKIVGKVDAE